MNNYHHLPRDIENLANVILSSFGYPTTNIISDNKIHRFGKKDNCWYICFDNWIVAGDWSGKLPSIDQSIDQERYQSLTSLQRELLQHHVSKTRTKAEAEAQRHYEEVANKAQNIWKNLNNSGDSLYLKKKGLEAINGIKFGNDSKGNFIATALVDNDDKIWSLQKIYDYPLSNGRNKNFLKGGKVKGCYLPFGNQQSTTLYICEGVATALSILLAQPNSLVIVTYDCGNLKPVTQNILSKYINKKIIIAGDNDSSKEKNIGKEKAEEVAKEFNLEIVLPTFKNISSKPSDFNDLHQLEGIEEVSKQLSRTTSTTELFEWEAPILFDNHETPEITTDILPSPLKEFAQELATSTETPEGMTVMAILSVLATSLQGKFEVMAQEGSEHRETVNLYTITTLPPANRKSTIVNACIAPLVEWEKEQREILEPEIKKQKSRYESEKKLIDDMRKKLKSESDSTTLIEEIAKKESEIKEPENLPRLFVNDITPESLANIVAEQKNRMSVFSDEGGIVDTMAGLYNGGNSNIDILLKGWSGGYLRQKRKDRELDINPLLTINLTVQPVIIQNLGNKKAYLGKGLLERFLYCLPKSNLGYRTNDKAPVSTKARIDYNHKIRELINIPYQKDPIILTLSNEAHKEWRDFQNIIETDLRPEGRLAICQGWGGKICGHALRIAGLLHVAQHGNSSVKIDKSTIDRALELCSLLTFHAVAAFSSMEIDQDTKDAKEILRWIQDNNLKFTKSELTKRMQNRSSMNAERLDKLLNILSQRNIVSSPIKEGKKTIRYIVNPKIRGIK